jgi:hypothetical protein
MQKLQQTVQIAPDAIDARNSTEALSYDHPIHVKMTFRDYEETQPTGVVVNALPAICENPENDALAEVITDLKAKYSQIESLAFVVPELLVPIFKSNFPKQTVSPRIIN